LPVEPTISYQCITVGSPDPIAKAIDAFSVPWSKEHPYPFAPFNLIGRALSKIQAETVSYACLIAPAWPAQG